MIPFAIWFILGAMAGYVLARWEMRRQRRKQLGERIRR